MVLYASTEWLMTFLIYHFASKTMQIKSIGMTFVLIAQVATASDQVSPQLRLPISHNFTAKVPHNSTIDALLDSSSAAKAGSLAQNDILNMAAASLKPSGAAETGKTTVVSGSIVAIIAISVLLSTSDPTSSLRSFSSSPTKKESKQLAIKADANAERSSSSKKMESKPLAPVEPSYPPPEPSYPPPKTVPRRLTGIKPRNPTMKKRTPQRVQFADCHIREFSREAGGGCQVASHGVPLGLGWDVVKEQSCTVDKFQEDRVASGKVGKELYISYGRVTAFQREAWLVQAGVAPSTMKAIAEESVWIQWGRQESNEEPTL